MNRPANPRDAPLPVDWTALDDAAGPLQSPTEGRPAFQRHRDPLEENAELQRRMVETLYARLHDANGGVRLVETHISFVLLTGRYAYKIKKAVKLPFVDFGTLELRKRFCEDELRLNRRLAPKLYVDVVPITGTFEAPALGGSGPILDYAVQMRQFPEDALASDVVGRNALTAEHVDALAAQVARFHAHAPVASSAAPFGDAGDILELTLGNFVEIAPFTDETPYHRPLDALHAWTRREHATIRQALERRRRVGAIRECHGDLHLGNIALVDGELAIFDCLEFNERMRWIDTMSDVAFTVMDFAHRKRTDLAYRFLTAYCEESGDYGGIVVLRYYLVYRAMVRAKIACLRASQLPPSPARAASLAEFADYLALASSYSGMRRRAIVLMHGPSGCGKTTLSGGLVERGAAIRVRTDVERKRLAGLAADAPSGSALDAGLYAPDATRRTYQHVLACAESIVDGGFCALVDGTFLHRWQRELFRELAYRCEASFVIVDCDASESTLKARVEARARAGSDASEADLAVLAHQLAVAEPLSYDELRYTIACDAERPFERGLSTNGWRHLVERLHADGAPLAYTHRAAPRDRTLADKVVQLSHPRTYQEPAGTVEPIETHLSWVFLTGEHAYKLKKPVRDELTDLRTLEARRRNCIEEVRVNARFTRGVYLDVVPLVAAPDRTLRLGGPGSVADWLVCMRRLPAEKMLDRVIAGGRFEASALTPVVEMLCRVYAQSSVSVDEDAYRRHLDETIRTTERELGRPEFGLPLDIVERIASKQRRVAGREEPFDARVRESRIVEGHGDLRPEHVCLEATPQIIDALEASRELRRVDAIDELGFLALECERLGAPKARHSIFEVYRRYTGDPAPDALIHFYQSFRAFVRARLAIRHLLDEDARDHHRWPVQAQRYLDLALAHIERCQ